jgi:hypothetical protein
MSCDLGSMILLCVVSFMSIAIIVTLLYIAIKDSKDDFK